MEECARRLIEDGCAVVAVSAGARGAFVLSAERERLAAGGATLASVASTWASTAEWVPAEVPRTMISTNGAGDAATAGLIYGLVRGMALARRRELAAQFAAASIAGERPSAEQARAWAADKLGESIASG